MDIILVSGRLAKARTLTITASGLALGAAMLLGAIVLLAGAMNYLTLRYVAEFGSPRLVSLLLPLQTRERAERNESYLRDSLNAMAVKLGEMQAQLLRLDTLGERLAKLAGFKPQDFLFSLPPARGGNVPGAGASELSLADLDRHLDALVRQVDDRTDKLGILDSLFTLDRAKKKMLPSFMPIEGGSFTSNFGWRIDPFTGANAYHEGVDFIAETGTPIYATAAGVVVFSDFHPQYGNMIEIDHGNDLITRYAHASKRLVKVGDMVLRGQKIAEVGATGRATGPHLHFEVRQNGAPRNPTSFLRSPG